MDSQYADRYPTLYAPQRWEWAGVDGQFSTLAPPPELVTNVHVVGFEGDRIVLCRDERDVWFLPGGTREPDESIEDCVRRELAEEAGAELVGPLWWVGAHHCVSDRPGPHRPHQAHPKQAWLWCMADVAVTGPPTLPDDGEHVLEVRAMPPAEAYEMVKTDAEWFPDLLRLAVELRHGGPPGA